MQLKTGHKYANNKQLPIIAAGALLCSAKVLKTMPRKTISLLTESPTARRASAATQAGDDVLSRRVRTRRVVLASGTRRTGAA